MDGEDEAQRTFEGDALRGAGFPFAGCATGLGVGFAAAASADTRPTRNTTSQMTERMTRDTFLIQWIR